MDRIRDRNLFEERMRKELLSLNPIFFPKRKHRTYEVSHLGRGTDMGFLVEIKRKLKELFLFQSTSKGELFIKHPVKSHPQRIDITFSCILFFEDNLRRSSLVCTDDSILLHQSFLFEDLLTQPEVPNLNDAVVNKNICWLDVAVNYFFPASVRKYLGPPRSTYIR